MRNVDCEWVVNKSHDCSHKELETGWRRHYCCHKELVTGWRRRLNWWPKCYEYANEHVDCKYRESLFDMIKSEPKNTTQSTSGTLRPMRPPPPPTPPPKRVIAEDVKLK